MTQAVLYYNLHIIISHILPNKHVKTTIVYTTESKSVSRCTKIKKILDVDVVSFF